MKNKAKHAVLIGAGELDSAMAVTIKNSLSKDDFVIALDGGLRFCVEHNIAPDMIVGDFDSLAQGNQGLPVQKMLAYYPQEIIYRLPCEKDDTDTLAAIKLAIGTGFTNFTIYGGLGGRLSHTMANIQSLLYLKERGLQGELVGNDSRVFLVKDECICIEPQGEGYISIFAYSEKAQGVTLKNLKYEISDAELTNTFPIGVSNEFVGKTSEISVEHGILLIVVELK